VGKTSKLDALQRDGRVQEERGDGVMTAVAISVFTIILAIELSIMNDNLSKIARELERIRREVTE
jgi:hypothetical protein